ncbi:MAG: GNAT family N-acetyltransferase [Nibricoccus sp.]
MSSTAGSSPVLARAIAMCADEACRSIDPKVCQIVQLLLEPTETRAANCLQEVGFSILTTLLYLQRTLTREPPAPVLPPGYRVLTYNAATHDRFARAILASYEQSLDCPQLHGKRQIADIIEGHKSSGEFDPNLWFVVTRNPSDDPTTDDCAALLLSPVPHHATMELVYIGLAPAARGHRLGDYFLQLALHRTHLAGLQHLTLAVDELNQPALRLYYRHGLGEVHRRLARSDHSPRRASDRDELGSPRYPQSALLTRTYRPKSFARDDLQTAI